MKSNITEGSYTEKDIPSKFYCVIQFDPNDPEKMHGLSTQKLAGVQGISQAKIIIPTFLGDGRDAMIVMRGADVVKHNPISRVMYSNPDYLVANNLAVLRRLSAAEEQSQDITFLNNFFNQLMRAFYNIANAQNGLFFSLTKFRPIRQKLYKSLRAQGTKINSVNQFSMWLKNAILTTPDKKFEEQDKIDLQQIPIAEISSIVGDVAVEWATLFEREGEWIVKNKTLVVPPKSDLFILIPSVPKDVFQGWKDKNLSDDLQVFYEEELQEIQAILIAIKKYNLSDSYTVRLMSKAKFMEAKNRIIKTTGMNNFLSPTG